MPISKKKKYNKKKHSNINANLSKNQEINKQIKYMNNKIFTLPKNELVNTYISYATHHSNAMYSPIDLKMNFINITLKTAFLNSNPHKELFGYIRDESIRPNFYLNIIKYVYNTDIALIAEASYFNEDNMILNIEPLKSLVYLADLLDLDLAFPAYADIKDPQEDLFKSLGFNNSVLKADPGQKILFRKAKKVDF